MPSCWQTNQATNDPLCGGSNRDKCIKRLQYISVNPYNLHLLTNDLHIRWSIVKNPVLALSAWVCLWFGQFQKNVKFNMYCDISEYRYLSSALFEQGKTMQPCPCIDLNPKQPLGALMSDDLSNALVAEWKQIPAARFRNLAIRMEAFILQQQQINPQGFWIKCSAITYGTMGLGVCVLLAMQCVSFQIKSNTVLLSSIQL